MELENITANEIAKHPKIIKGAQMEIVKQDVLVCGGCHAVFHFVEQFTEHKEKPCPDESQLKDCREVKAKVWAFLLWKGSQVVGVDSTAINSWQLYQEWVKMDPDLRETWIVAGKNVQTFAKMGQGTVQEVPNKFQRSNTNINEKKQQSPKGPKSMVNKLAQRGIEVRPLQQANNKKNDDKDWSGGSDVESEEEKEKSDKVTTSNNKKESADKENIANTVAANLPSVEIKPIKKDPPKDVKDPTQRKAIRTCKPSETDPSMPAGEYTVEKILAKRFNPRRKQHEYLLKWEGHLHDNNTWEPAEHLEKCHFLLDQFEKQLAKQKEQRAAAALRAQQAAAQQKKSEKNATPAPVLNSSGRPQRNSKVKAMDHMKQWVGSINDDSDSGPMKRRADSDSDSEISEKKMKLEPQGRGAKSQQPAVRIVQIPRSGTNINLTPKAVNGVSSKNSDLAQKLGLESPEPSRTPLVVANSKGVVKVDPKQMPNLTSGVYIMSKNSGIIKLDSSPTQGGVVMVKDGKKQPTISPIRNTKKNKTEGQVKVIQKGENLQSGIVRVPNQTTLQKLPPRVISTGVRAQTPKTSTPIQPQFATRPGMSRPIRPGNPKLSPNIAQTSQIKRTSITPNRMYGRGRGGRITTPDQRSGISKNTETSMNDNKKKVLVDTQSIAERMDLDEDDDADDVVDLFPTGDLPPLEPSSPPRPLTLCPITGRVLGQAEGEPTPEPSPEPAPEPVVSIATTIASSKASEALVNVQISPGGTTGTLVNTSGGDDESVKLSDSTELTSDDLPVPRKLFSTTSDGTAVAAEDQDDDNDNDQPVMITGEDGTIYQVAGENAEGQTILVAQGADGEQQCVYVTADQDGGLTLDTAVAEAVANMLPSQVGDSEGGTQFFMKTENDEDGSNLPTGELLVQTGVGDDNDGQVVAEVVQADLPSPGGTRRVVLLLPDGNFMMTEVDEEQFAALNITT